MYAICNPKKDLKTSPFGLGPNGYGAQVCVSVCLYVCEALLLWLCLSVCVRAHMFNRINLSGDVEWYSVLPCFIAG